MTWETIQKEDFLTTQNKIQKSSDSERLKRMSVKWAIAPAPTQKQYFYFFYRPVIWKQMLLFFQNGWCRKTSVRKQGLRTQAESAGEWGKISVAAFLLLLMQKNIVCKDNNCPAIRTEKCGYSESCLSSDGVLLKCSELDCRYFGTGQHVQTSSSSTHIKRCVWIPNACVFNSFIWPKLPLLELFAPSSPQMLSRLPPVLEQASVMPLLAQGRASLQSACRSQLDC